jgi:putative membrane protein
VSPTGNPLLDILLGCGLGIITGLIPGLHVNTLAAASLLLPGAWNATLLAAGTTHTVVNIIPATQFGGGDDADAGLALPARQLALAGRLKETIRTSVTSSLIAGIMAWQAGTFLENLWQPAMEFIAEWRTPILLGFLVITIGPLLRSKQAWATMLLAGALGFVSAQFPMPGPAGNQALLPLLTGLFAVPILLEKGAATPLFRGQNRLQWRHVKTGILDAAPLAMITAMLPGITSGVASRITKNRGEMAHVAKISALNTIHAILALHIVEQTGIVRTGLAATATPLVWAAIPLGLAVGAAATLALGTRPMPNLRWPILALLATLVIWMTLLPGTVLWIAAACIGIYARKNQVSPVILTACLWLPLLQY